MGADAGSLDASAIRDALRAFLARSAASDRLLDLLGHLDAGRALRIAESLATGCEGLIGAVRGPAASSDTPPPGAMELAAACETFLAQHAPTDRRAAALGHIGWAEVVDHVPALGGRYGHASTRSIDSFASLLRYLSGTARGMTSVLVRSRAIVPALVSMGPPSAATDWDTVDRLMRDEIGHWARAGRTLEAAASAVSAVLTEAGDFDAQRNALAGRAKAEPDASVARLLAAIAGVRSPHAWIVRSPAARLTFVDPVGGFCLRLGFADGLCREIVLGPDYWNTTGLDMDPERFAAVRVDAARNQLVWSNGFADSGDRLHLAISEGRLESTPCVPINPIEVVPGQSVGPFRLGMTREEVVAMGIVPMRRLRDGSDFFSFTSAGGDEPMDSNDWMKPGARLSYNAGRCDEILAVFGWDVEPPIFTLLGRVLNGMTRDACAALLRAIAPDVSGGYGSIGSASAGVSAGAAEASDELIMCVTVRPPRESAEDAGPVSKR